jgi:hypothetical protein
MPPELSTPPSRRLTLELLLGLSAIFLSLAALTVSIFQTKILREQQHASVWPYLETQISTAGKDLNYGIINKGIGPAIIKEIEWRSGDSSYKKTQQFLLSEIGSAKGLGRSALEPNSVFSPQGGLALITVYDNDSLSKVVNEKLDSESFNLRIIYSDVYGNCWELDEGETTQLSDCPN